MAEIELAALRWRTGRRVGRTIYAQLAGHPSDTDPLIGVMDSVGLAIAAVRAHNVEHELERPHVCDHGHPRAERWTDTGVDECWYGHPITSGVATCTCPGSGREQDPRR